MDVSTKTVAHAAPGQYLGYALQPVRLCFHLLDCPAGAFVSLEQLDDVAVHYADGSVLLEQTKSALSQNPISNWANDLWKAISNWLTSIENGQIDLDATQFRIYVTPVHSGEFASAINSAQTAKDVSGFTTNLVAELKKQKGKPGCLKFLQAYLDSPLEQQVAVISRLTIDSTNSDPIDALRALMQPTVSANLIDTLCQYAIGAAKEQADELIRKGAPANLSGDDFKKRFHAFVQRNNLPGYLAPLSSDPTQDQVWNVLDSRPTFIRQLELIEATKEQGIRAVSDFLRASADKTLWADAGLIFEEGLRDWDADLVRRHGFIAAEIAATHPDGAAKVRGQLIYNRCGQLQPPMDGRAVPGHFVHGCFNSLANDRKLGWHPEFLSLLSAAED